MTLKSSNAPSGSKPQEPIEPGSYPARLVQIIDLGLQPQMFEKEEKPPKNEIMTTYELADEFMKDEEGNDIEDKPRWVSETFTLNSLNSDRAKSTARYYALDPDSKYDGDWSKLLETPATVTIVNKAGSGKNKGKVYNNIATVSAMRPKDAVRLPELKNPAKFFDLDAPDVDLFLSLPDFIQKKIREGLEFNGSKLDELLQNHKGKPDNKKAAKKEEVEDEIPTEDEDGNW
jgi:hypothetical protein